MRILILILILIAGIAAIVLRSRHEAARNPAEDFDIIEEDSL